MAVDCKLAVPELVVEEVVSKFAKTMNDEVRAARRNLGKLSRLLTRPAPSFIDEIDHENEVESFRKSLSLQLTEAKCNILDYPKVPHSELVSRAIARKRPFDKSGSGYRDTLVWKSVLELAADSSEGIVLISPDGDFLDNEGQIHSDLVEELEGLGYQRDTVTASNGLRSFLDSHMRPRLKRVLEDRPIETLTSLGIDLKEVVATRTHEAYSDREIYPEQVSLPWEYETLYLAAVDDVVDLEVEDVREVTADNLLLSIHATAGLEFEAFVHKSDAYHLSQLAIYDSDWNDHYVWGGINPRMHCYLDVNIDVSDSGRPNIVVLSIQLAAQEGWDDS